MLFWKDMKENEQYFKDQPSYAFDRIIVNNPRVVSGFSSVCNLLGVVVATGSILKEVFKKSFSQRVSYSAAGQPCGIRMAEGKSQAFEEWVAAEYSVERNKMDRATNRLHRVLQPIGQLKTSALTTPWVATDISFAAENIDDCEEVEDFEFAASARGGAVFSK